MCMACAGTWQGQSHRRAFWRWLHCQAGACHAARRYAWQPRCGPSSWLSCALQCQPSAARRCIIDRVPAAAAAALQVLGRRPVLVPAVCWLHHIMGGSHPFASHAVIQAQAGHTDVQATRPRPSRCPPRCTTWPRRPRPPSRWPRKPWPSQVRLRYCRTCIGDI